MLRKSLKHEFRATTRVMLPVFIALVLLAVAARFSVRLLNVNTLPGVLKGVSVAMLILFVISLIAAGVGVIILTVVRFYRSFLSNEGYLTMTLPVSVHTHISSRLIVSVVWYALTAVAITLCVMVMALSSSDLSSIFNGVREMIEAVAEEGLTGHLVLMAIEFLILCVTGCSYVSLLLYAALAVGHSFNRHKKGLSVLFAFAFYHAVQILGTVAVFALAKVDWNGVFIDLEAQSSLAAVRFAEGAMGVSILVNILLCAVFYFITHFFLSRKLNLE